MKHTLPELPYAIDALEPSISRETLEYHYGKHLQGYIDNLNKLIVDTEFEEEPLLAIIERAPRGVIYNNAAQVWNHLFYFENLAPAGTASLSPKMRDVIEKKWGTVAEFKEEFNKKAMAQFGSGWTWLVINPEGELEIFSSSNAECIAMDAAYTPILVCDVWEHAYYIDTRNARAQYLENFWKVVNWTKIEERYTAAETK
ncbi:superoxide dismutase [Candidatus Gracilibacteria bacterium GN02-873]|jgi:superoxide dismutase (Fe)|nr:superoxide dismutase [Candidatus Gracilibacteria bacterium GN02-873]